MRSKLRCLALLCFVAGLGLTAALGYDFIRQSSSGRVVSWRPGSVTMRVKMPTTRVLQDGNNYATAMRSAMDTWNAVLGRVQLTALIEPEGAGADLNDFNEIFFASDIYGEAFGTNVLAVTTTIYYTTPRSDDTLPRSEADVVFNSVYNWDSYRGGLQSPEDIRRVAIHELGHALGLDHPDEATPPQTVTAIMNSRVSSVDTLRQDDIDGGRFLYGADSSVSRPANDNFANAATLSGSSASATVSSVNAVKEHQEPFHAPDETGGASIWWRWTAPGNGPVTIKTEGSDFDTLLGVYTGGSVSTLTQIAGNDDVERGVIRTSIVNFEAVAGTTYSIAVDGWDAEQGNVTVQLAHTNTGGGAAPVIATQPSNVLVASNSSATFSVTLSAGATGATYRWQRLLTYSSVWGDLSDDFAYTGTTTATLRIGSAVIGMSGEQYRVVVSNPFGSVTSDPATLTVGSRPTIFTQPTNQVAAPGGSATFTVSGGWSTPVSFQWFKNGTAISGANSQSFTIANAQQSDVASYTVTITNDFGSTTSNAATLSVFPPPTILTQPVGGTYAEGTNVYLSVLATDSGTLTYQWYRAGVAISGATSSVYWIDRPLVANSGNYYVVVSNGAGTATSNTITLTFTAAPPPQIIQQPTSASLLVGDSYTLSVWASSSLSLSYQWQKDGVAIPGATFSSYLISNATLAAAGDYRVVVSHSSSSITSAVASVRVRPSPPPVLSLDRTRLARVGDTTAFTVNTTGSRGPFTYQWYRDGVALAGATSASLYLNGVQPSDYGDYYVAVTNAAGTSVSNSCALTAQLSNFNNLPAFAWRDAVASGGVVYFAFSSPQRLSRYDLSTAQWLEDVALPGEPYALAAAADGALYVSIGASIRRFDPATGALSTFAQADNSIAGLTAAGDFLVSSDGSTLRAYARATGQLVHSVAVQNYGGSQSGFGVGLSYDATAGVIYGLSAGLSPADISAVPFSAAGVFGRVYQSPYHGPLEVGGRRTVVRAARGEVLTDSGFIYRSDDLTAVGSIGGLFDDFVALPDGSGFALAQGRVRSLDAAGREQGALSFSAGATKLAVTADQLVGFVQPTQSGAKPAVVTLARSALGSLGDAPAVVTAPPAGLAVPQVVHDGAGIIGIYSKLDRQVYRWSVFEGRWLDSVPLRAVANQVALLARDGGALYSFGRGQLRKARSATGADAAWATAFSSPYSLLDHGTGAFVGGQFGATYRGDGSLHSLRLAAYEAPFEWSPARREFLGVSTYAFALGLDQAGVLLPTMRGPSYSNGVPTTMFRVAPDGGTIFSGPNQFLSPTDFTKTSEFESIDLADATWIGDTLYTLIATPAGGSRVQARARAGGAVLRAVDLTGFPLHLLAVPGGQLVAVTYASGAVSLQVLASDTLAPAAAGSGAPVLVREPAAVSAAAGERLVLSVDARGAQPLAYQWAKDGTPLAGATSRELVLTALSGAEVGNYTVTVSNTAGSATSAAAAVSLLAPPIITTQPQDQFVAAGSNATFTVAATGGSPLSYRWYVDGVEQSATGATFEYVSVNASTDARVRVVVRNAAGAAYSRLATVATNAAPVLSSVAATRSILNEGATLRLSATLSAGASGATYQWRRDGVDLPGAISATYELFNASAEASGSYTVVVTNAFGSVVSEPVVVRVLPASPVVSVAGALLYLKADGTLWAIGSALNATQSSIPAQLPIGLAENVVAYAPAAGTAFYLKRDGSLYRYPDSTALATDVATFAVSDYQVFYVKRDGTLWARGANDQGQLGDGTTQSRTSFVQILDAVRSVVTSGTSTYAVRWDDTLWAWGYNSVGQLATGNTVNRTTPGQVATGVREVQASSYVVNILKRDGSLVTAGSSESGRLGSGYPGPGNGPSTVATDVRSMSVGSGGTAYLNSAGTLYRFGAGFWSGFLGFPGYFSPQELATGVTTFASDFAYTSIFVRNDQTLWGVGYGFSGSFGSTSGSFFTPVQISAGPAAIPHYVLTTTFYISPTGSLYGMGSLVSQASTPTLLASGPLTAPTAPTGVTSERFGAQVAVNWTPSLGATEYEIWRRAVGESTATVIGTTTAAGLFIDTPPTNAQYIYSVRARHLGGSSASSAEFTTPVASTPVIVTQPANRTAADGAANVTFTVVATGARTYQWRRGGVALANGGNFSGVTTATLTLASVSADDAGSYDVVLGNANGTTTSSSAALTISPASISIDAAARTIDGLPRRYTIAVTSDGGWTTSSDATWVTAGPARGTGNGTVTVLADANLTGAQRSATLTIGSQTHVVTQAAAPAESRDVWLVGADSYGQLGQSRLTSRNDFGFALPGVKRAAVGERTTYFLRDDDSLWFTGVDLRGGYQSYPAQAHTDVPTQIATGVVRVAAGSGHFLYVLSDGTLVGAGGNGSGQLGTSAGSLVSAPRPISMGVRDAAAGSSHTVYVKTDGTVWGLGSSYNGALGADLADGSFSTAQAIASGGLAVSAGDAHTALLKTDGTLWLTGYNSAGQLGVGDTTNRRNWVQVATGVAQVHCLGDVTLFRKTDGSLWGMGNNAYGQLGAGGSPVTTPRQIAPNVTSFAAGGTRTFYVTTDGTLWVLGYHAGSSASGARALESGVASVSSDRGHTVILKTDGSAWTAGANDEGQLGARTRLSRSVPAKAGTAGVQLGFGEGNALWLDSTGTVRGAGFARYNQLNTYLEATGTPRVVTTDVTSLAVGNRHSLVVKSDGSLAGFGANFNNELGLTSYASFLERTLQPSASAAYAGYGFSFFLKPDRTLWAMGRNDSGQLGTGTTTAPSAAVQVLTDVVAVAPGYSHTAVLRGDRTLWVTGYNGRAQLGFGDLVARSTFTRLATGVRSIAVSGSCTAWVALDGTAWAVGFSPVMDGDPAPYEVPRRIATDAVTVVAGYDNIFVLRDGGELLAGGTNNFGQLARGGSYWTPTLTPIGIGVFAVAAGEFNTGFIAPAGFLTAPQPPSITVQPQPQAGVLGGTATFSVTASGAAPLTYQWQRNGVDLAGATSSTLSLTNLTANDLGAYSVTVTNAQGVAYSEFAALDIALPPTIATAPASATVYTTTTATLSVVATGRGLSYQWQRNGNAIEGATGATLTLANLQLADAGTYRVVVSNAAGSVTSAGAVLTVLVGAAPSISLQPTDQIAGEAGRVAFRVVAAGTPAVTYRWQRLGLGGSAWQDIDANNNYQIVGTDTPTLMVGANQYTAVSGDQFRVVVSNVVGSVTSNAATLSVSGSVGATSVAGGYTMTAYVTGDGYAWVTGGNNSGQLGDGSLNARSVPGKLAGQGGVVAVHTGFEHTLFIKMDGSLWTTGDNQLGQLADGTTSLSGSPVRITHGVAGGSGGYRHTLFRLTDGRLWAAGWNSAGQLGTGGTTTPSLYGVSVANNVIATAAGFNHSIFVKGDGTAWAMGANGGLYGDGTTANSLVPVQVATGVAEVASFYHTAYLKRDGSVWATGRNDRGQLGDGTTTNRTTAAQIATGVVEVAVGALHTVLLKSDGTVWASGANDRGQLGDGTTTDRSAPVQVASGVMSVSAGLFTTVLLKTDGSVWITGANDLGQLGDGTAVDRKSFYQLATGRLSWPLDDIAASATNSESATRLTLSWLPSRGTTFYRVWRHTANDPAAATLLADRVKGTYYEDLSAASGVNYYYWVQPVNPAGALPLRNAAGGRYGAAALPPTITTPPASQTVTAGGSVTFSVEVGGVAPFTYQWLKDDADLPNATGTTLQLTNVALADAGAYRVRVSNAGGSVLSAVATLTVNAVAPTISDPPVGGTVVLGSDLTLSVTALGTGPLAYQWTKDGADLAGATSATLTLTQVTDAAAGTYRVRVTNSAGSITSSAAVVVVVPPPPAIMRAANGYAHSGYVRSDGKLFMMGDNSAGQLGDGTTTNRRTPVEVASGVVQVAVGSAHTAFLKQDGTLWSMGSDGASQLGGNGASATPVQIASDVAAVQAAWNSTVFLKRDGTLYGLGQNEWSMFGAGPTYAASPRLLGTDVIDFSVASRQLGFVRRDGTAWVCGYNRQGQLGVAASDVSVFTPVASGVRKIRVSGSASFLLKTDGSLWATGRNFNGQLGDGTMIDRATPVQVAASGIVDAISGSSSYNMALWLRADGALLWVGPDSSVGSTLANPATIATGVTSMALGNLVLWTKTDGSLAGFGYNDDGDLGLGEITSVFLPGQTIATGQHLPPVAPTGVNASAGTVDAGVRVQWTPVLGATSYEVWRGATSDVATATKLADGLEWPIFYDNSAAANSVYHYHVRADSPAGSGARSATATGYAGAHPVIVASPVAQSALAGDAVTFAVDAIGTAPLAYQWRFNGAAIAGATSATYTIASARTTHAGNYDVVVSNGLGLAYSDAAVLTVTKRSQTITFAALADRPFSATPIELSASASSGLPVALSLYVGASQATLSDTTLTLRGAGMITIRATQAGDEIYAAAPTVDRTFFVTPNFGSWQSFYFTPTELLDGGVSGSGADADRDGLANLVEYALGLDPRTVNTTGMPQLSAVGSELVFTYTRPADRADVSYTVEQSTDLVTWSATGVTLERTATDGTTESWRATAPLGAGARTFLRLRVEKP